MIRLCVIDGCERKHHANGYCQEHNRRYRTYGDPLRVSRVAFNPAERLEDCRWMAETGEHLDGAAERLGLKVKALEKWLYTHDRDTLNALVAARPKDHNRVIDGMSVSDITGQRARRQRRRQRAA